MSNVTYKISEVTGKLSARIANLEVQLAHSQAANEAYAKRVAELNNEKETDEDESTNNEKK